MELYLQYGHGMKNLCLELSRKWGGLTTILSPRDMLPKQLINWSKDFDKNNVSCLFDPQCYYPKTNLKKLSKYDYWNTCMSTNIDSRKSFSEELIESINKYNKIAKTTEFIIPNTLESYNEDWLKNWVKRTKKLIDAAMKTIKNKPIIATITLPHLFLAQKEDEIELLINELTTWDVDGFYIIAETPNKQYLVDSPQWLSNVLQICAALKISGKKVIYGYGNHQSLILSLVKIDAIASGNWQNVRSFTNRFTEDSGVKRRSTWIYYPQSLSEYKLPFIDYAYNNNILKTMKPDKQHSNEYSNMIYETNILPSATALNETIAFKHYLTCLKRQVENLNKASYKATKSLYELTIVTAEREIERLEKNGVYAQSRSFREIVDINRAAMQRLDKTRGVALSYSWNSL